MYVEGEHLLADVAAMCASTDADLMGGSTSLSGRFRELNQSLNDRASSLPMYAISTSRPSICGSPFLRRALCDALLAHWTSSSKSSCNSPWRRLATTPDGGLASPRS